MEWGEGREGGESGDREGLGGGKERQGLGDEGGGRWGEKVGRDGLATWEGDERPPTGRGDFGEGTLWQGHIQKRWRAYGAR